jgi:hypothetical protein
VCLYLFNNKSNRTRRKHKHPLRQNYWKGQQTTITTTKRGGTTSVTLLTLKNSSSRIPGGGEFSRFLRISWLLPPGKETNRDFVPRMRGQFYCPESVGETDHSSIMQKTGLKFSAEYVCSSYLSYFTAF